MISPCGHPKEKLLAVPLQQPLMFLFSITFGVCHRDSIEENNKLPLIPPRVDVCDFFFFSPPGKNESNPLPLSLSVPLTTTPHVSQTSQLFFREEQEVVRHSTLTWLGRTTGPLVLLLRTRSNGLAGASVARLREPAGLCGAVGARRHAGRAVPLRSERRRSGPGGGQ